MNDNLFSPGAGAVIPFLQALITGIFAALIVLAVAIKLGLSDLWFWPMIGGLMAAVWVWSQALRHWWSLTSLERMTGLDINNDGVIGEQMQDATLKVHIQEHDDAGNLRAETRAELPRHKMSLIADQVINNQVSFSVRELVERRHLLSRAEFEQIRDEMMARGMLVQVNPEYPKLGYSLTRAGMAVMRNILTPSPA